MWPGACRLSSAFYRRCAPCWKSLRRLQRATLNGELGVWMNDADAGNLALWLYEVTP